VQLAASREGALDAATVRAIAIDLEEFATSLAMGLSKLPAMQRAALKRAIAIIQASAEQLDRSLIARIGNARQISFSDTFRIMAQAQQAAAETVGVPFHDLGAIRIPRLADAHAFVSVAQVYDFRTLARAHVVGAAKEAVAIVRVGILQGTAPEEIARAIRPYMLGASGIPVSVADLRRVPAEYRGQAKQLAYNANRIAYSETHAARMLAQAVRMRDDPFVAGGKWHTAPNRGKGLVPDICDVLRDADFFGLGPGVYPAGRIPAPPHPWDRCNVTVVPRVIQSGEDWRQPKPAPDSYPMILDPRTDELPHLNAMTPAARGRVRRDLAILLGSDN